MGRESRPRLLDLLLSRPLPVPLTLTTSTVESMLVTGTHTRTSPLSLTPSFRNTMEFHPTQSTHLTWMPVRSEETLLLMSQFTLPESGLVAPSMDLVFPPESPRSSVWELRN